MSEAYLKEVTLPSRGLFYGDKLPGGIVQIEPLGTREEKLFAAAKNGASIINKIFDSCVKMPMPHQELVLGDRLYLLLQLRSISYGDTYAYPYRCTDCKKKAYGEVKIPDIQVRSAPDDATGRFEVTLPINKHTLELRLLTGTDEEKVDQFSRQLAQRNKGDTSDDYTYRHARRIEKIDGKPAGIKEAMALVDSLKGKDTIALRDAIEAHDVGPELEVEPECTSCGYLNGPFFLPMDSEFFRPRSRSASNRDDSKSGMVPDESPGDRVE